MSTEESAAKLRVAREQHASMRNLTRQLQALGCWDTARAVADDADRVQAGNADLEAATTTGAAGEDGNRG